MPVDHSDYQPEPKREAAPRPAGILDRLGRKAKYGISAAALLALLGVGAMSPMGATAAPEQQGAITANPAAHGIPSFADLVARVKPAVVSIRVKADASAKLADDDDFGRTVPENPFKGTPFEKFFKDRGNPFAPFGKPNKPGEHERPVLGQGSGFFISADGYIVTNNHVVDGAFNVEVVTDDGKTLPAKVIGTDPRTDVALVKVKGDNFPHVKLSHHNVRVGDWVIALGNPFGLGGTVTAGIVSARGRDIGMSSYDDFIQIDAPVNKGNSGGPTFNQDGEVVGMNTAIFSPSGGSVGIAFAIPAATVESVVQQLKDHGHVTRGWLGVQIQKVTPEIAESVGLDKDEGALVAVTQDNSPASKAGIKSGDVILEVNGNDVKDSRDLAKQIANISPGTTVRLDVLRDRSRQTVEVKLGELPDQPKTRLSENTRDEPSRTDLSSLGLGVRPADGDKGLAVVSVDPEGKAADTGIAEGDVILKANGADVSRPSELESALEAARKGGKKNTLALIKRGDNQIYIALPTDLS